MDAIRGVVVAAAINCEDRPTTRAVNMMCSTMRITWIARIDSWMSAVVAFACRG